MHSPWLCHHWWCTSPILVQHTVRRTRKKRLLEKPTSLVRSIHWFAEQRNARTHQPEVGGKIVPLEHTEWIEPESQHCESRNNGTDTKLVGFARRSTFCTPERTGLPTARPLNLYGSRDRIGFSMTCGSVSSHYPLTLEVIVDYRSMKVVYRKRQSSLRYKIGRIEKSKRL